MDKKQLKFISELFGNEIRTYRVIEKDKTQEGFSQDSGIGPEHIGEIERGEKLPRIDTLLRLYNAGIDINRAFDHILKELEDRGIDIRKDK
ncbi:helix-turn-helix domain-containing protein [Paucisalibacillus sp. EB02]|uniref:helix-turn-helix domain-containing protein n=1 Tax=Paucisalibacillus sp. EB02 TaxID=1347087 RepID=UPI0004AEB4C4|nr:helix-turn-helix transcriptional regulator [Paucisalibacillus sp. EB02]